MATFQGSPRLKEIYDSVVTDLAGTSSRGLSTCLAGQHGVGKTMTVTNIIKAACIKGYTCLYTTLSDIVAILLSNDIDDKYLARKELINVDYLVIDEFDTRFMASESASDLFGRTVEGVFRTRSQNRLPTFFCTNSPNISEAFQGSIKDSLSSLMKGYVKNVIVIGDDFRKIGKKGTL